MNVRQGNAWRRGGCRLDKLEILTRYFGYRSFRPGQEHLIDRILEKRDVLGIMPTGSGKSICYQVPALMLSGTCLVISPLISLMQDQVMALKAAGIPAAFLNASLTENQMRLAMTRAAQGVYKIIYVAPERLRTPGFQQLASQLKISMVAVDEAHCVSQWGHEFRPEYQRIAEFVHSLHERPHYCAFTATATEEVKRDIIDLLGLRNPYVEVTGFDRPNLFFEVCHPKDRDGELLSRCAEMREKAGIIYCMSRKNVEAVCELLNRNGLSATRYHAGLPDEERQKNQEDFQFDRVRIMVATNAFGMGIDKSNVRYVIHYNLPLSMEAYYQEAGRAGRDGLDARCILLFQKKDIGLGMYLLENSESKISQSPAERMQIQDLEQRRFRDVQRYAQTQGCLRRFILQYFGEKTASRCAACSNCMKSRRTEAEAVPDRSSGGRKNTRAMLWKEDLSAALRTPEKQPSVQAPTQGPSEGATSLFEYLQQVRGILASNAGLPPYIVCSDQSLMRMADEIPLTTAEIAEVPGMSYAKARAYGEAFVHAISQWILRQEKPEGQPENVEMLWEMRRTGKNVRMIADQLHLSPLAVAQVLLGQGKKKERKKAKAVPVKTESADVPSERSSRVWHVKEINWLRMLYEKDWTVHTIARQMGRSDMEIVAKLRLLGLKPRYDLPDEPLGEDTDPIA